MEKRFLYTLKDVVFGLRTAYQAYEAELEKLKEYCVSNSKIEDFYFYVHQSQNQNPKLYCDFIEKRNNLRALATKAKDLIVGTDISANTTIYENDKLEGIREKSPIVIIPDKKEEFNHQASKILTSDFISSTRKVPDNGIDSLCGSGTLYIRPNNIEMIPDNEYALPKLFYSPLLDTLTLSETDSDFKVSEFGINKIMEMYFFVDSFPDYHITSMNLESIRDRQLVIEHFEPCKKIELNIKEDNENIILSKVMK